MADTPLYQALRPDRSNVRLLTLLPGTGQIRCSLQVHDCRAAPKYEALSYFWGDPTPAVAIQLNGKPFSIARNLSVALQHLRLADRPRVLWVDAVCINQKDLAERSQQVLAMTRIYVDAQRVLVWLGEGDAASDAVFDAVPHDIPRVDDMPVDDTAALWVDRIERHLERQGAGPGSVGGYRSLQDSLQNLHLAAGAGPSGSKTLRQPNKLRQLRYSAVTGRPWWSRVWVVQEVVLNAHDPLLVCGSKTAGWEALVGMLLYTIDMAQDPAPGLGEHAFRMNLLREHMQHKLAKKDDPPPPQLSDMPVEAIARLLMKGPGEIEPGNEPLVLATAMTAVPGLKATDPRDHIYGLLGISSDADQQALQPNYEESVGDVFRKTAQHLLGLNAGYFSMFSFCRVDELVAQKHVTDKEAAAWPSWVPNFAGQPQRACDSPEAFVASVAMPPFPLACRTFKEVPLRAPAGTTAGTRLAVHIHALVFDTVETAVPLRSGQALLRQIVYELDGVAYAAAHKPLPDGHPFEGRLVRDWDVATMVLGRQLRVGPTSSFSAGLELARARIASHSFLVVKEGFASQQDCFTSAAAVRTGVQVGQYDMRLAQQNQVAQLHDYVEAWGSGAGAMGGRHFFTTRLGFCGISTAPTQAGDVVTVGQRERKPVLFRPRPELTPETEASPYCTVVGAVHLGATAYNNEFFRLHARNQVEQREFDVI